MKIHFIAIGGSVMHNLALDILQQGHLVTGSDDEIFEPSRTRLQNAGLLPAALGWFPDKITQDLDAIVLGMHAHKDNPELLKALDLQIPVYSYPEFIYRESIHKKRIVVGGSHGKTTITSMIMHVLRIADKKFDYLVGAQLEGFDRMVKIDPVNDLAVFEGDEYLSSTLNPIPKFHIYHPHIAIISGIAWDHMNVFPTFENYCDQFIQFIQKVEPGGFLIYCENDLVLKEMVENNRRNDIQYLPYQIPAYEIKDEQTFIPHQGHLHTLKIFGEHNLMNMEAARLACQLVGIEAELFYNAMQEFTGAAKRLEIMHKTAHTVVFKDFAHSPSKLSATIHAVKLQYPQRKIIAFVELHTYSSLNKDFLEQYQHTMDEADIAVVFYSPHTLSIKKLPPVDPQQIADAFVNRNISVFDNNEAITSFLQSLEVNDSVCLMMSSGNWNGVNVFEILKEKMEE